MRSSPVTAQRPRAIPASVLPAVRGLAAGLALLLIACSGSTEPESGLPENTDLSVEWPTASPEEQGFDPALLATAFNVARVQQRLTSMLVVRNGFLVAEEYFAGKEDTTLTNVYAVTTSFLSALVGIAIDAGYIESPDQTIEDFLVPAVVPDLDAAHRAITIRDLLTMTSGLEWQEETDLAIAQATGAVWEFALGKPVVEQAGARINYNSGAASLLSVILTRATGMETLAYARQALLGPLGIDSLAWRKDGGYWYGASSMQMRPRDMAKLGALFVNGGVSDGRSIVPTAWVQQSLTPIEALGVPYRYGPIESTTYGFMWWIDRQPVREAFFAWGWGGQFVYCVPALRLVVVTTTAASDLTFGTKGDIEKALLDLIIDRVVPAVVRG
jgi:CubicO group peptidase (beta-lactamase class C family)